LMTLGLSVGNILFYFSLSNKNIILVL